MPAPLHWEQIRSDVSRASRVVPGYGTVIMIIRYLNLQQVFMTAVMLPEPEASQVTCRFEAAGTRRSAECPTRAVAPFLPSSRFSSGSLVK